MSQHDFNIANQSFPATRTDLNNALAALASNSSGDAEPATKYANQWWYETDTNTLKLRNEANDAWISIAVLDQSGNAVQSITTAGLTLGATAISATGAEINQLDAITRGSILYGNASGATARLAKGAAGTVLTSDGTDLSFAALPASGAPPVVFPSDWASPTNTYNSSGTWSKGSLGDDDYVWFFMVGGGQGGGGQPNTNSTARGGEGGRAMLLYGKAEVFDGGTYTIGTGGAGGTGFHGSNGAATSFTPAAASYVSGESSKSTGIAEMNNTYPTALTNILELVKGAASSPNYISASELTPHLFGLGVLPTNYITFLYSRLGDFNLSGNVQGSVFSGGSGCSAYNTGNNTGSISLFSGNGGASSSSGSPSAGTFPGGGGGGSAKVSGATGAAGAAGQVRVYHV